jgi:hypothetical protein
MQISVFIHIIFLYLFCMTSFRTFCASDYKLVYGSDTVLCLKNFICISLCIMDFYVHVLKDSYFACHLYDLYHKFLFSAERMIQLYALLFTLYL